MKLSDLKQVDNLPDNIKNWLNKNELDKMTDGEWFDPGNVNICQARIQHKVFEFNHTDPTSEDYEKLANELVPNAGGLCIVSPFYAEFGYVEAGENCFIGNDCCFIDGGGIFIGNDVMIAPKVTFATATHPINAKFRREKLTKCEPIIVEDNVWIGTGAIICGGVTIGENSIIGAGSVVTHDIPANVVAVGNPCKVIKKLILDEDLKDLDEALKY